MRVGDWHIQVEAVEDWREDYGYVLIRGRVQEDNTEVEFYAYPEEGYVSAYEVSAEGLDLDWPLGVEEQEDVFRWVRGWLEAQEALQRGELPEPLEFPAPDWEKYSQFGCDVDGGNYCTFVVPIEHYNEKKGRVEYYIRRNSSREIGEMDYLLVDEETGELYTLPEEVAKREGIEPPYPEFFHVYADLTLLGPFTPEEFAIAWAEEYQEWEAEMEAYEEWKARVA